MYIGMFYILVNFHITLGMFQGHKACEEKSNVLLMSRLAFQISMKRASA